MKIDKTFYSPTLAFTMGFTIATTVSFTEEQWEKWERKRREEKYREIRKVGKYYRDHDYGDAKYLISAIHKTAFARKKFERVHLLSPSTTPTTPTPSRYVVVEGSGFTYETGCLKDTMHLFEQIEDNALQGTIINWVNDEKMSDVDIYNMLQRVEKSQFHWGFQRFWSSSMGAVAVTRVCKK